MTFQPVVAGTGIVGWRFLQATYDNQFRAFSDSPVLQRDVEYFIENITNVRTASELVDDRRLLSVALGAFGLEDDLNNKFFVRTILEEGTLAQDALAVRLSDDRYQRFSEAFGFGPSESLNTTDLERMQDVADLFRVASFESAVGDQDETMRIALFAQRELNTIIDEGGSEDTQWFNILGSPPLRQMFETAFGLPSQVSQLDLDKQLEIFRSRAASVLGASEIQQFSEPEQLDQLTNLYLARSQISAFAISNSSASNALVLLQSASLTV